MIRVLHVVTIMNRNGLENRIMDIYRNIDRTKVQFDFLTHRQEDGAFDEEIRSLGGIVYHIQPVSVSRIGNYLKDLKSFFAEHKNEYNIVHSHVNTLSTWVLCAAKKAGIPIRIAHSRTWGMERTKRAIFKYFSRAFINIPTTHKFGCSRQAGEWLFGKKGIAEPNYFRVIPNSISLDKFEFNDEKRIRIRKELQLEDDQLAFVHVGRFTAQKNHVFLLKVFESISKKRPGSRFFLIGGGELENDIDSLAKEYGISDNLCKLGTLSNVGDYLCAMDGFVFPSLFEGFGTVTIESQCCGLPIIASDTIPMETKVSDIQEFDSLKNSPEVWADHILDMIKRIPRKDCSEVVKQAGYDITDTYTILQKFYLEVTEKI